MGARAEQRVADDERGEGALPAVRVAAKVLRVVPQQVHEGVSDRHQREEGHQPAEHPAPEADGQPHPDAPRARRAHPAGDQRQQEGAGGRHAVDDVRWGAVNGDEIAGEDLDDPETADQQPEDTAQPQGHGPVRRRGACPYQRGKAAQQQQRPGDQVQGGLAGGGRIPDEGQTHAGEADERADHQT